MPKNVPQVGRGDLIDDLPTLRRYYAHYEDDGADHPDEAVEPGEPWNRLYVFHTPKAWLDFLHDVQVETFRLNARVTGAWAEGDDHYEQVSRLGGAYAD